MHTNCTRQRRTRAQARAYKSSKSTPRLIRGSTILDHTGTRFLGGQLIRGSDLYASIYGNCSNALMIFLVDTYLHMWHIWVFLWLTGLNLHLVASYGTQSTVIVSSTVPSGCWSTAPHAVVLTVVREHYYCLYLYMLCRLMYWHMLLIYTKQLPNSGLWVHDV